MRPSFAFGAFMCNPLRTHLDIGIMVTQKRVRSSLGMEQRQRILPSGPQYLLSRWTPKTGGCTEAIQTPAHFWIPNQLQPATMQSSRPVTALRTSNECIRTWEQTTDLFWKLEMSHTCRLLHWHNCWGRCLPEYLRRRWVRLFLTFQNLVLGSGERRSRINKS